MRFGLSDKPSNESAYTLRRHVELVTGLLEKLQLKGVTIVGQDWGGPISLRYAIDHQDNVRSMVSLNTMVRMRPIPLLFTLAFRNGGFSSFLIRNLEVFRKIPFRHDWPFRRPVEASVLEQYRMPHPHAASRAGIAAFPKMIPGNSRHPKADYIFKIDTFLQTWNVPVLVMFSDGDIAFKIAEGQRIADMVPNGRFQVIQNAGHYLREDAGEEIAQHMVTFLKDEARIS